MASIRAILIRHCEEIDHKIVSEYTGEEVLEYACESLHLRMVDIDTDELSQRQKSILYYAFAWYVIDSYLPDFEPDYDEIPNRYGYMTFTFNGSVPSIEVAVKIALST